VQLPETALAAAVARVGDRWTLQLISALLDGPRRFGELEHAVAGIAPNILTNRLRRLEQEGIVLAQPYSERPRRLTYTLSAEGAALADALRLLADWGAVHETGAETGAAAPHRCPHCGERLDAASEGVPV
jgi:DNA-binding HxlR family transcriptional regulator